MHLKKLLFLFAPILLVSCIDPVAPEFDYFNGQIYVEAFAASAPGSSYVIINRSTTEFGLYRNVFEVGAKVSFRNLETDLVVNLEERESDYAPPADFAVAIGETWELNIRLKDGRQLQSEPEIVVAPVAISDLSVVYNPELKYIDAFKRFAAGHQVLVSFDDPVEQDNFYYWRFKSYEKLIICQYCPFGKFRNGQCETNTEEFSYACETDCWRIRYNEKIELFSDKLTNGMTISSLPIADVLLYSNKDILVRIEQLSLSPKAYEYYKTLKDLVDNSAGLNAPPPAALVGNMFSTDDSEEFILGRFTTTATATFAITIERSGIEENPLEDSPPFKFESGLGEVVVTEPCNEGRFRTGIRPEGWQD